jgi:hypothetical protein
VNHMVTYMEDGTIDRISSFDGDLAPHVMVVGAQAKLFISTDPLDWGEVATNPERYKAVPHGLGVTIVKKP